MWGREPAQERFRSAIGIKMRGIEMGDARAEAGVEHGARGGLICGISKLHGAKGKAAGRGSVGGGDLHGHGAEIAMWMLQRKAVTLKVESHELRRGETEANPNPSQGAHAHENA